MTAKAKKLKPTDEEQVAEWMDNLDAKMKPAVEAVRKIIKGTSPKLN